jgi:DNA-binding transcriptional regulator YdaS (Cro superfamily)
MTYEQLIKHFGTQQKAANAIGIDQTAISKWHKAAYIPFTRQFQIQIITGGVLQADKKKKAA